MPDIKTKGSNKGVIKTLDKAAIVTQRMKQSYIATKNKAEHSVNANTNSAEEYASEKFEGGADEIVHDGAYAFDKAGRKSVKTTKDNIRSVNDGVQRFKRQRAERSLRKQASQNTNSAIKTVDKAEKAWIIVTSQQDIDSITKTKGNDFSKIQGRFDTRLSLSSANVDEVIKKRTRTDLNFDPEPD